MLGQFNISKEALKAHEDRKLKIMQAMPEKLSEQEKWVYMRQCSIGASDVATVLGINKYKTKYQLWQEKTGRRAPFSGNAATHWGQVLEKVLLEEFQRLTSLKVITWETIQNNTYPYITYSPDGVIIDRANKPIGLWEAKTAKQNYSTGETDEDGKAVMNWGEGDIFKGSSVIRECDLVPDEYMLQVQTGMLISNAHFCKLSALISTSDFRNYTIRPNAELQDEILKQVKSFWEDNVLNDVAPEMTYEDLKEIKDKPGTKKQCSSEIIELVKRYKEAQKAEKEAQALTKNIKSELIKFIDTNQIVEDLNGRTIYTYKSQASKESLDLKKLELDRPDIFKLLQSQYMSRGSHRVLRISKGV